MKKVLSILLSVVMIALTMSCLGVVSFAEDALSGTCGDNIAWSIKDGVLTVTGTGAIEPQEKIVDGEYYVDWHQDPDTGEWVGGEWKEGPHPVPYFPWEDATDAVIAAQLGEEDFSALMTKIMYGLSDVALEDVFAAYSGLVKKIVIGEGITAIAEEAFGGFLPASIILPASLATLGEDAFNTMVTTELVIKNPALDFELNEVEVPAFAEGATYTSPADFAIGYTKGEMTEMWMYLGEALPAMAMSLDYAAKQYAAAEAAIDADEELTPEQKTEQKTQLAEAQKAEIQEEYGDLLEGLGLEINTYAEGLAVVLKVLNYWFGTSYTSMDNLYTVEGEGEEVGFVPSEAFYADYEAANARYEELAKAFAYIGFFPLGTEFKDYLHSDIRPQVDGVDEGDEEDEMVEFAAAPWLTVYGPAESTAKAACEVSKVKFVALEDAKAAFEAAKQEALAAADAKGKDGDSDSAKKLISDAKDAINAVTYDETKTPEENKAAFDAILAKLDTDLAAQRDADARRKSGGYGDNAFMRFIKKIIQAIKDFFAKIFKK